MSNSTVYYLSPWKGVVLDEDFNSYLHRVGNFDSFLHANYKPIGGPHYHGNPIKGWHDWFKVLYGKSNYVSTIDFWRTAIDSDNITDLLTGKNALVHFVN